MSVLGGLLGGTITDTLKRKFGKEKYNKIMHGNLLLIGVATGGAMLLLSQSTSIYMAIICITVALFNIGGAIIPLVIGAIVGSTGSYFLAILLFACFGLGIGLCSLVINFNKKIGE